MSIKSLGDSFGKLGDFGEFVKRDSSSPVPSPLIETTVALDTQRLSELRSAGATAAHKLNMKLAAATANAERAAAPPTLSAYRADALHLIGGRDRDPVARNKAITGAYAAMYLKNPEAFRWSGAAAHASSQVGLVLEAARDAQMPAKIAAPVLDHALPLPLRSEQLLLRLLGDTSPRGAERKLVELQQMMGDGNIALYENIMPAMLAYDRGGITELRRLEGTLTLDERTRFRPVLSAFENIDQGVRLLSSKDMDERVEGEQLIQQGNAKIIDFEQRVVLQRAVFDKHPEIWSAITPFSFGDLDGEPYKVDTDTLSTFYPKHYPHSISNEHKRTKWIMDDIFPKWYTQRMMHPNQVQTHMRAFVHRGREAGARY